MIPRPPLAPARPWNAPMPTVTELDNGITVWMYNLPGQHIISCNLVLDLPISAEPVDGVGTIAARVLDEGTSAHPELSFAEALEGLGGQFHGLVGQSTTQCLLDVPASTLPAALDLFAEAVIQPTFGVEAVERTVGNRLAEIDQQQAHGSVVAGQTLRRTLLADGLRIGRPSGGTPDTISSLTRSDIVSFHETSYHPHRAILIIAGDLATCDPVESTHHAFDQWLTPDRIAVPEVPQPGIPSTHVISRPGSVQTDVRMGWFGIDRGDPRWPALEVALTIMGGSFSSRLNMALREEKGYTYGISMHAVPFRTNGLIEVAASTRTQTAHALVEESLEIMSCREGFTPQETAAAIGFLVGSTPVSLDTAESVASQAATIAAAQLPLDYVDTSLQKILDVTADQATEAYRCLIDVEAVTLVMVGDDEAALTHS